MADYVFGSTLVSRELLANEDLSVVVREMARRGGFAQPFVMITNALDGEGPTLVMRVYVTGSLEALNALAARIALGETPRGGSLAAALERASEGVRDVVDE